MTVSSGPCETWAPPSECFTPPEAASQDQIDFALRVATEILWHRTGRRYGLCTYTLRPCRDDCLPAQPWIPAIGGQVWGWPFPALIGGAWFNLGCGLCNGGCSCTVLSTVTLPSPVSEIVQIKVDGVVLDPSAYRVDDWRRLVRLDGGSWPRCNDLTLDDTEAGTWSVMASYGESVPALGMQAVGELATEILKNCLDDQSCRLSPTLKQVTRQGVTKVFFSSEDAFTTGLVGLYWPDLFIRTVNPTRSSPAAIFDIDGPRHVRAGTS